MKQTFLKRGLLLLIPVFLAGCFHSGSRFSDGLAYLQAKDSEDINEAASQVKAVHREQMSEAYQNGTLSSAALFGNSLLLGDSRAASIVGYGHLLESQSVAQVGIDARTISTFADVVAARQPDNLVICYSVNDMQHQLGGMEPNGYADFLEEQIDVLLEAAPNARVYINSMIPVSAEAAAQEPSMANPDFYNEQIQALCEKRGWFYIDNSSLPYNDYYERDGEHLQPGFYPDWIANIIQTMMETGGIG